MIFPSFAKLYTSLRNNMKQTLAIIASIILPSASFGTCLLGIGKIGVVAEATAPFLPAAEALGDRSIGYWFIALAVVAIASWTWIVRWLIKQIETQREAHTTLAQELISYLKTDHANNSALLSKVGDLMGVVVEELSKNKQGPN